MNYKFFISTSISTCPCVCISIVMSTFPCKESSDDAVVCKVLESYVLPARSQEKVRQLDSNVCRYFCIPCSIHSI